MYNQKCMIVCVINNICVVVLIHVYTIDYNDILYYTKLRIT